MVVDLDVNLLTMEDKCLNCGKNQEVGEEFLYFEPEGLGGHITFCSEKCLEEYKNKCVKHELSEVKE